MLLLVFSVVCCLDVVILSVGRMAGPLKATTGLAGLAVAQYPHRMLSAVYQKILRTIKNMPEDYAYRKNTQVTPKPLSAIF